jgi:hypothetical protein
MNALLVLVRYKLLIVWRRVKDNFFTLFVLGPLILGFVYLIAVPYLRALALGVYSVPPRGAAELSVAGLIFLFLLAPASSVAAEFYPLQSPDSYLDSLPISNGWRFCELALFRAAKNLPIVVALGIFDYLIGRIAGRPAHLSDLCLQLLLPALLQLTGLQILIVLLAAHYGFLKLSRMLPMFGVLFTIAALIPAAAPIALFPIAGIKGLLLALVGRWFGSTELGFARSSLPIAVALAAIYFVAAFLAYRRWRINDREAVERAISTRSELPGLSKLVNLFERRAGAQVAAMLYRDLILTFRFFSSAVYLSIGVAFLFEVGLIVFCLNYIREGEPFEIAVQAACALASFALASLSAALVKHQLAFISIERSLPVHGIEMYHDKLWYSRILSLPAPLISFVLALILGSLDLQSAGFLLFKLLLVWILVASLVGALAFEIASRPGLAIPFAAITSLSIASLTIRLWWLWIILYPYIMDKLEMRARERAYILLKGIEGDSDND